MRARATATTTAVVLVMSLGMGLSSQPTEAAPTKTPADQLQFFNISLRLVNSQTYAEQGLNWRAGFSRIAAYANLADVITVLEVPLPKRGTVLKVIEAKLGADYGWIHSDSSIPACTGELTDTERIDTCGNTMIAFRTGPDGLAKRCDDCGVMSWVPFNQQDKQPCAQRGNATHVMARLLDREQGKIVTVVPVHFDPGLDEECLSLNLKKLNDMQEASARWRNRPMAVVVGDLNEHPDPRHDDKDASLEASWRREEQKACWYKRFSLQTPDDGCDQHIWGTTTLPYSEAVGLRNGTGTSEICDQWTFNNNKLSAAERSAVDVCEPDNPDELKPRKRIDHLWVRYETSDGTAITDTSSAWWGAQIVEAGVDRGWYQSDTGKRVIYSDHRMLHALLSWCGAQASGSDTPCS